MTFKVTTKDQNGNPVQGINLVGYCPETAQCWRRTSDGNGYSDLAIENPSSSAVNLDIVIEADGFKIWSQSYKLTEPDQIVQATLIPF